MGGILYPSKQQLKDREFSEKLNRQQAFNACMHLVQGLIQSKIEEKSMYRGAAIAKPAAKERFDALIEICDDDLALLKQLEAYLKQL